MIKQQLNNCISAIVGSLEKNTDEKTLAFLVLSEFLHAYGTDNYAELYKNLKDNLTEQEFKDAVVYNISLQNGDVEDIFNAVEEKGFEKVGISNIVKKLDNYNDIINTIDKSLNQHNQEIKEIEEVEQKEVKQDFNDIGFF